MINNKYKVGLNTVFKRSDEAFDNAPREIYESLSGDFNKLIQTKVPTLVNFLESCYTIAK